MAAREALALVSARWAHVARQVSISTATPAEVFGQDQRGLGWRCFIKHYCLLLHGRELAGDIRPCQAEASVAWAFSQGFEEFIAGRLSALDDAPTEDEVRTIGKAVARRTLLAAAGLASVVSETWTTDRETAVDILRGHFPDRAAAAQLMLQTMSDPSSDTETVRTQLIPFADWVARELRLRAGPSRHLEEMGTLTRDKAHAEGPDCPYPVKMAWTGSGSCASANDHATSSRISAIMRRW